MTDPNDLPPWDDDIQGLLDAERSSDEGVPKEAERRVWAKVSATIGLPPVTGLEMDPTGGGLPAPDGASLLPADPGTALGAAGSAGKAAAVGGSAQGAAAAAGAAKAAGVAGGAGAVAGSAGVLSAKTVIIAMAAAGGISGASYVALKDAPPPPEKSAVVQVLEKNEAPPPPVPIKLPENQAQPPAPPVKVPVEKAVAPRPGGSQLSKASARRDSLKEERRLLEAARSSLRANQAQKAQKSLSTHKKRFPKGKLVEEREALSVLAAFQGPDLQKARQAAEAFFKRFPKSLFRSAIEAARDQNHPR
jgi:hypothetical protein